MARPNQKLARSVIPSLASIAIHAALALALLGVTIERFTAPPPRPARLAIESAAPPAPTEARSDEQPPPTDPQPARSAPATDPETTIRRAAQDARDRLRSAPGSTLARAAPAPPVRAAPPPVTSATPAPPAAAFAGVQAQAATRIVFAVDASGAMVTSFSFVQDELARAIDRLQPTQSFQVVLFAERTGDTPESWSTIPHTGDDDALIRATAANRVLARRWIYNALPGGRSNPVEGLTRALEFDPDLVFLLARGIQRTGAAPDPADHQATLATLDTLNPVEPRSGLRPTVIKAIEFIEPDPTGLIEQIARIHGDGQGALRLITPTTPTDEIEHPDPPELDPAQRTALNAASRALAALRGADTAVLARIATDEESESARTTAAAMLDTLAPLPPPTRRTTDPRPHLLRARAALLAAALEPHPPKREDLALQALADLTPLRITDPAAAAERDILSARARVALDQPAPAHQSLLALLRTADPRDPNLSDDRRDALLAALDRARIALLDAATALGPDTPDAARARDALAKSLPSVADPATRARAAAALVRANLDANTPDPLAPLVAIATDRTLPEDTRRALAAPRLAVLAEDTPPTDLPLPALRVLADHATWPPADHARAARLLEHLAARTNDPAEQAAALRDAALHADAAGDAIRARELAFRLAERSPDHPDTRALLALVLSNPEPDPRALRRALDLAPAHPLADTWRLALANATVEPDAALALLAELSAPSPASATLALARIDEALARSPSPERRAELLARAATEAARLGDDLDPERRLLLARSLATTDPDRALRTLADLPPSLATAPEADSVRLDAAGARTDADAAADRFETARAIANRRSPSEGEVFWRALTIWLELGAQRGGPDAARAARLRIAALRREHPDLGGEPWRTRLNAIAD